MAQRNLGIMYDFGHGVTQNYAEAMKWYRKAADQGYAMAQANLGIMYDVGHGVPQNYAEAMKWYRKAANQGNAVAQRNLGIMYEFGRGVPQNYAEAMKWYRKAADHGNASGQYSLGSMYVNGQGVPQNYAEAMKWYRKAADQGYAMAQSALGSIYVNGRGVPQDDAEAMKWYRKAADQGEANGQMGLGFMYGAGRSVPQNYIEAHMWYSLAASRYDTAQFRDEAIKGRDTIASLMTPAQIADAQRLAEICIQNDFNDCGVHRPQVARRGEGAASPPVMQRQVTSTGTGFFATENGHVVTNAHVVKGCLTVRSSAGGEISKVSIDEQSDLALYIASEKPKAFAQLRGGRGARTGETVVAIGFPLSGLLSADPIVTTGVISALSGLRNDRRTIQVTAPVGNSGGPLLGENGSVVGVVVSKLDAMKIAEAIGDIPQNINFAVSLGTLQSFLNANGVPYQLNESNAPKAPADIAAEAARFTVRLECLR
jgi:TPR repeat protein